MDYVKCEQCGWAEPIDETETHFCGKNEIPLCPMCGSDKIVDIDIEEIEDEKNTILKKE